jgi:hypothetical protein
MRGVLGILVTNLPHQKPMAIAFIPGRIADGQYANMHSGAIRYVRGHIKMLDRTKLESTVCECYQVVKDEFDRLLGT